MRSLLAVLAVFLLSPSGWANQCWSSYKSAMASEPGNETLSRVFLNQNSGDWKTRTRVEIKTHSILGTAHGRIETELSKGDPLRVHLSLVDMPALISSADLGWMQVSRVCVEGDQLELQVDPRNISGGLGDQIRLEEKAGRLKLADDRYVRIDLQSSADGGISVTSDSLPNLQNIQLYNGIR